MVRVVVDPMVCEANGICEQLAPDVFQLDDSDELQILQPEFPPELEEKVRLAVDRCPKLALAIVES